MFRCLRAKIAWTAIVLGIGILLFMFFPIQLVILIAALILVLAGVTLLIC